MNKHSTKFVNFKNTVTDGFNPELVEDAFFAGTLEFPIIAPVKDINLPRRLTPISKIKYLNSLKGDFIHFYENDCNFIDFLNNINTNFNKISRFSGIIGPDCSVYWDSPLAVQIINIYRNHAYTYYFQSKNKNTIPNIRWGDERTYTDCIIPGEIFAFVGYPKHSVLAIGNYGCYQTKDEKRHFNEGLKAMIKELEPIAVIVYGSTKNKIFKDLSEYTTFYEYKDWITTKRRSIKHGNK